MKTTLVTFVLVLLAGSISFAQELDLAWFGAIGGGLGIYDNGPFSRRLQMYTPSIQGERLLYRTEDFANTGYTLNASLGLLLAGRYVIGVNGERVFFPTVASRSGSGAPQDKYALGAFGGGLDLGYAVVNGAGSIIYPFLHVGYYGHWLDYTNNHRDSIPFFEGRPVPGNSTATFTATAPRLALGIGMTRYVGGLSGSDVAGLVVNARLSYGRMPKAPKWKQDGQLVNNGGNTPEYNAVELAVTVGFGTGR